MPRKRAVAIEETTTRRVTLTEEDRAADTAPIPWALQGRNAGMAGASDAPDHRGPGWPVNGAPLHPSEVWNAQRAAQRRQALGLLVMVDQSLAPGEPVPEWVVRQAVTILRALPGATPLELTLGRST